MSFEIEPENADMYAVFRAFEKPQDNGTTETRALNLLARLPKPAIIKDEEGRTLLHLACINGWYQVADVLINTYFCVPTRNSTQYGTPLHQACAGGHLELVSRLVVDENCDPNCKSGDGTTPLHYACSCGKLDVAKFLIEQQQCDVNSERDGGATPLHEACAGGHLELVKYLVRLPNCDVNCKDNAGSTPLHYACSYGHVEVAAYLMQEHHCSVKSRNKDGATPLHEACANGQLNITKFLVNSQACKPKSCVDSGGWTPLHYACDRGHFEIAQYLIEECHCNPKSVSNNGSTPLHSAFAGGNIQLVRLLIEKGCNPTKARLNGITPLHEASSAGHLDLVKYLTSEVLRDDNPDCLDDSGMTPLHYACSNGHVDVARYLVEKKRCFVQHRSNDGVTPLQRACSGGHLEVVKFLVEETSCTMKDNLWYLPSPVQIAYDNNHIDIVSFFIAKQKEKSSSLFSRLFRKKSSIKKLEDELLHRPFFKMFVVGEAEVGKSTLIKALEHKLTGENRLDNLTGRFRTVTGVEAYTAGIIPVYIERPNRDRVILYDLAGQPEYYSSHAALLESLVSSTETLILIVVKLTEDEEKMVHTLNYWSSIIASLCQRGSEQESLPTVMVVGSYADDPSVMDAEQKLSAACSQVNNAIIGQASQIVLNCTRLRSRGLGFISWRLSQQCRSFQSRVQVDMQVNFVNAMIKKYLSDKVACQFSEIVKQNGLEMNVNLRNNGLLPSDRATLCEHVTTLSDHGRLLFLKNEEDINSSWVILKLDVLLSEVNGTIFAPTYFEQKKRNRDFSNNTGVVRFSKIKDTFFRYNGQMIMDFLLHFEFCHIISEPEAQQISTSLSHSMSMVAGDNRCYFFPALVTVDRPDESRKSMERTHYRSGWCLVCEGNDIFPSQFLHVLLIRLAFSKELLPASITVESNQNTTVIQKECSVWKSGIHWIKNGVDTIVEVVEKSKAVVLTIGCMQGSEVKCVKQRSSVIQEILKVKSRFAEAVKTCEYLINREHLTTYPLPLLEKLSKVPIACLTRAVKEDEKSISYHKGVPVLLEINTLLHFEPYASLSFKNIVKLQQEVTDDKEITDAYLSDIACDFKLQLTYLQEIFVYSEREFNEQCRADQLCDNDSTQLQQKCFKFFNTWKLCQAPTFGQLQAHLDSYSVFCGRNPLTLGL